MINKIFVMVILLFLAGFNYSQEKGHLLIIGGGSRPDYMMEKVIELAGGEKAKIVVVPNASGEPYETALYQVDQFKKLGVKNVEYILCSRETADADSNLIKMDEATGIFFSGGDQSRLTRDLLGTKIFERINEIYNSGGILSGTSAGAAIMSDIMLTGNELINKDSAEAFHTIQKNNIETVKGFGFVKKAVIDQHFIKRKRNNRLISVILENPHLMGVGIDESTSIIVNPDDTFDVLGENQVIIYDATGAENISVDKNNNLYGHNLKMHILASGQKFDLNTKSVIK